MVVPEIFVGSLEIFGRCLSDFLSVSWRYLIGVLEIFDEYPRDICSVS